nr:glycosyltransferase [uncultured Ligilactobacillus sp.]
MNFNYIPVIVTFNRCNKLIIAINSLLKQTIQPQKIIIVDNHSNDGTEKKVKEKYSNELCSGLIEYHYLQENIGGSGGFHKGVEYAVKNDTDYIAVSDDDAFYREDYFEKIKEAAIKYPYVKAFQGISYNSKNNEYMIEGRNIINWNTLDSVSIENQKKDVYADLSTFVGLVFSKDVVLEIGYPIDNFFIWNDDAEYSLRMKKITKILQVNSAVVNHCQVQREGGNLVPVWKTYYGFRNRIILRKLYAKNKLKASLYDMYFLIRQCLATLVKENYRGKRKKYFKAFIDAYKDAEKNKLGKNDYYLP